MLLKFALPILVYLLFQELYKIIKLLEQATVWSGELRLAVMKNISSNARRSLLTLPYFSLVRTSTSSDLTWCSTLLWSHTGLSTTTARGTRP